MEVTIMGLRELKVSGLTPDEAQEALNRAKMYKNIPIQELQKLLWEKTMELLSTLIKDNKSFAAKILEEIKRLHPELLKDI